MASFFYSSSYCEFLEMPGSWLGFSGQSSDGELLALKQQKQNENTAATFSLASCYCPYYCISPVFPPPQSLSRTNSSIISFLF